MKKRTMALFVCALFSICMLCGCSGQSAETRAAQYDGSQIANPYEPIPANELTDEQPGSALLAVGQSDLAVLCTVVYDTQNDTITYAPQPGSAAYAMFAQAGMGASDNIAVNKTLVQVEKVYMGSEVCDAGQVLPVSINADLAQYYPAMHAGDRFVLFLNYNSILGAYTPVGGDLGYWYVTEKDTVFPADVQSEELKKINGMPLSLVGARVALGQSEFEAYYNQLQQACLSSATQQQKDAMKQLTADEEQQQQQDRTAMTALRDAWREAKNG